MGKSRESTHLIIRINAVSEKKSTVFLGKQTISQPTRYPRRVMILMDDPKWRALDLRAQVNVRTTTDKAYTSISTQKATDSIYQQNSSVYVVAILLTELISISAMYKMFQRSKSRHF